MNLKTKLTAGIAMGAFLVGVVAPVGAFAADVTISSNGKDSTNKVKVTTTKKTMVSQKNASAVKNNVGIAQNTGGNKANGNTGAGVVSITTGNAKATVTNNTTTGGNTAVLDNCGCMPASQNLTIKDNGKDSTNTITVSSCDSTMVSQMNMAWVVNEVGVIQNTGMNSANGNTVKDGGDPSIATGNANATVTNNTTTGDNVLGPAMAE